MVSTWGLLLLCLIGGLFWRHRQQAEQARGLIYRHCQQLELQVLDIHYAGWGYQRHQKPRWFGQYQFEFTNVPNRRFSGRLLIGARCYRFELQPYPDPSLTNYAPIADSRPVIGPPNEET
ncbi:DUF3301 domain-containing protein [Celerinatantimonas yamalensis]|uniref:DUF3301 domain-containing protein n=1 Tax=Celerinatantimonas yamalensis TaxID=559956 RepID=A0ABW9GAR0_9GAMM